MENRKKLTDEYLKPLAQELKEMKSIDSGELFALLKIHKATLDQAKIDAVANIVATMICVSFVAHCKKAGNQHDLKKLVQTLGEEDLNLSLLVNVENTLRKYFPHSSLSLHSHIADVIQGQFKLPEKIAEEDIDKFCRLYKEKHENFCLYNDIFKKEFAVAPLLTPKSLHRSCNK